MSGSVEVKEIVLNQLISLLINFVEYSKNMHIRKGSKGYVLGYLIAKQAIDRKTG